MHAPSLALLTRCSAAHYRRPQQQPRTVVPVVQRPAAPGAFPGLYAFAIPEQGFADSNTLLITSTWGCHNVILAVGLSDGSVTRVTDTQAAGGSWALQVRVGGC